jgi:hypothetical protein
VELEVWDSAAWVEENFVGWSLGELEAVLPEGSGVHVWCEAPGVLVGWHIVVAAPMPLQQDGWIAAEQRLLALLKCEDEDSSSGIRYVRPAKEASMLEAWEGWCAGCAGTMGSVEAVRAALGLRSKARAEAAVGR